MKARMIRLEKVMKDVSSQQQTLNQNVQSAPASGAPPTSAAPAPAALPPVAPTQMADTTSIPPAPTGRRAPAPSTAPAAAPVEDLYKTAFNDFMAARYNVASAEFNDVIKAYPDAPLSGNSWYYLGEIDYRAGRFAAAAKDYDKVLEQYPDNNKIPAAHLHKGQALIELKQTEAGVRELRALIQRFPPRPRPARRVAS